MEFLQKIQGNCECDITSNNPNTQCCGIIKLETGSQLISFPYLPCPIKQTFSYSPTGYKESTWSDATGDGRECASGASNTIAGILDSQLYCGFDKIHSVGIAASNQGCGEGEDTIWVGSMGSLDYTHGYFISYNGIAGPEYDFIIPYYNNCGPNNDWADCPGGGTDCCDTETGMCTTTEESGVGLNLEQGQCIELGYVWKPGRSKEHWWGPLLPPKVYLAPGQNLIGYTGDNPNAPPHYLTNFGEQWNNNLWVGSPLNGLTEGVIGSGVAASNIGWQGQSPLNTNAIVENWPVENWIQFSPGEEDLIGEHPTDGNYYIKYPEMCKETYNNCVNENYHTGMWKEMCEGADYGLGVNQNENHWKCVYEWDDFAYCTEAPTYNNSMGMGQCFGHDKNNCKSEYCGPIGGRAGDTDCNNLSNVENGPLNCDIWQDEEDNCKTFGGMITDGMTLEELQNLPHFLAGGPNYCVNSEYVYGTDPCVNHTQKSPCKGQRDEYDTYYEGGSSSFCRWVGGCEWQQGTYCSVYSAGDNICNNAGGDCEWMGIPDNDTCECPNSGEPTCPCCEWLEGGGYININIWPDACNSCTWAGSLSEPHGPGKGMWVKMSDSIQPPGIELTWPCTNTTCSAWPLPQGCLISEACNYDSEAVLDCSSSTLLDDGTCGGDGYCSSGLTGISCVDDSDCYVCDGTGLDVCAELLGSEFINNIDDCSTAGYIQIDNPTGRNIQSATNMDSEELDIPIMCDDETHQQYCRDLWKGFRDNPNASCSNDQYEDNFWKWDEASSEWYNVYETSSITEFISCENTVCDSDCCFFVGQEDYSYIDGGGQPGAQWPLNTRDCSGENCCDANQYPECETTLDIDCNNSCQGESDYGSFIDDCGYCSGANGTTPSCRCERPEQEDNPACAEWVLDGGVCGPGNGVLDSCEVCGGSNEFFYGCTVEGFINTDIDTNEDCENIEGFWGPLYPFGPNVDECGVCLNIDPEADAYFNSCTNPDSDLYGICENMDCAGNCTAGTPLHNLYENSDLGGATVSECGICIGVGTDYDGDDTNGIGGFMFQDCNGDCHQELSLYPCENSDHCGYAVIDDCGTCCQGGTTNSCWWSANCANSNGCEGIIDCSGECGGESTIDYCGVCSGGDLTVDVSYQTTCNNGQCTGELEDVLTCGDLPSELPNNMNYPNAECVSGFVDCTGNCYNSESFNFCINSGATEGCFDSTAWNLYFPHPGQEGWSNTIYEHFSMTNTYDIITLFTPKNSFGENKQNIQNIFQDEDISHVYFKIDNFYDLINEILDKEGMGNLNSNPYGCWEYDLGGNPQAIEISQNQLNNTYELVNLMEDEDYFILGFRWPFKCHPFYVEENLTYAVNDYTDSEITFTLLGSGGSSELSNPAQITEYCGCVGPNTEIKDDNYCLGCMDTGACYCQNPGLDNSVICPTVEGFDYDPNSDELTSPTPITFTDECCLIQYDDNGAPNCNYEKGYYDTYSIDNGVTFHATDCNYGCGELQDMNTKWENHLVNCCLDIIDTNDNYCDRDSDNQDIFAGSWYFCGTCPTDYTIDLTAYPDTLFETWGCTHYLAENAGEDLSEQEGEDLEANLNCDFTYTNQTFTDGAVEGIWNSCCNYNPSLEYELIWISPDVLPESVADTGQDVPASYVNYRASVPTIIPQGVNDQTIIDGYHNYLFNETTLTWSFNCSDWCSEGNTISGLEKPLGKYARCFENTFCVDIQDELVGLIGSPFEQVWIDPLNNEIDGITPDMQDDIIFNLILNVNVDNSDPTFNTSQMLNIAPSPEMGGHDNLIWDEEALGPYQDWYKDIAVIAEFGQDLPIGIATKVESGGINHWWYNINDHEIIGPTSPYLTHTFGITESSTVGCRDNRICSFNPQTGETIYCAKNYDPNLQANVDCNGSVPFSNPISCINGQHPGSTVDIINPAVEGGVETINNCCCEYGVEGELPFLPATRLAASGGFTDFSSTVGFPFYDIEFIVDPMDMNNYFISLSQVSKLFSQSIYKENPDLQNHGYCQLAAYTICSTDTEDDYGKIPNGDCDLNEIIDAVGCYEVYGEWIPTIESLHDKLAVKGSFCYDCWDVEWQEGCDICDYEEQSIIDIGTIITMKTAGISRSLYYTGYWQDEYQTTFTDYDEGFELNKQIGLLVYPLNADPVLNLGDVYLKWNFDGIFEEE